MAEKNVRFITIISMIIFLGFIYYETTSNVKEYVADTIFFMVLVLVLFLLYKKLDLDIVSYTSFILALLFHNAGAFGWYNISPIGIQWDHVTHIAGSFAPTLILFRFCRRFFTSSKFNNFYVVLIIILASLGVGVFIEYYEFAGSYIIGEGEGGLGQGAGDFDTELGSSLYLNTMLDLVFNLIGALLAVAAAFLLGYNRNIR